VPRTDAGLVDIVREFLSVHGLLRRLFERHHAGSLRFEEVQALAGDNESSPLFRLKERCHGLFRAGEVGGAALFDLAVGSLFHEAMKLRENLYQLEVYAPKVERARARAGPGSEGLFEEFERILVASRIRLAEALAECEALLEQTRRQFQALLASHKNNGLVIRYLIANTGSAEAVLGEPLDSFFARAFGDAASAYALAARSYLESGYFDEARQLFAAALLRDPARADLQRETAYADGMSAYLRGRYEEALTHLEVWMGDSAEPGETSFREMAHAAMARLPSLLDAAEKNTLGERALALARTLESGTEI
jgi:tetratricopeptide (TPR) repeat protein